MAQFFLEFLWENFLMSRSTILFFHWLCKLGAPLISQETVLCSCEMTFWRPGECRCQFTPGSLGLNCFPLCCWSSLLWWAHAAGGAGSYWGSDEREGSCLVPWAQETCRRAAWVFPGQSLTTLTSCRMSAFHPFAPSSSKFSTFLLPLGSFPFQPDKLILPVLFSHSLAFSSFSSLPGSSSSPPKLL